jgi:hypothetical protein
MPIITKDEVKSIGLQTALTTWDTLIASLIPIAQAEIIEYCKNSFVNTSIQLITNTIAFVSGTTATITDSASSFVTSGFIAGDYKISGSSSNDKIVTVGTVAAGTLTLATGETLNNEDAGDAIVITKVDFPVSMKFDVAQYIVWMMRKDGKLVNSESLPGGWSGQYKTKADMLKPFNLYSKPFN